MARLRVHAFALSLDGCAAGRDQRADAPFGDGCEGLHDWMFATRFFREMSGQEGGTTGPDDDEARAGFTGIGATIMGRNMFGPVRGPWPDTGWTGWWGPNPPDHHDVFVLTHHPRSDLAMAGGTTFHFVVAPIPIGDGERLLDGPLPGYHLEPFVPSGTVVHARVVRA